MRMPATGCLHVRSRGGSALLIALWALLLLSAAMFAWVQFIDQGIQSANEANRDLEARALAYSGVSIALHPGVKRSSPLLTAVTAPDAGYKVALTGEAAKLNLNYLLAGEDQAKLDVLRALLARRGLPISESSRLIDCMLDWIDTDNIKHMNGSEDEGAYRPPNRGAILSLDEVVKIKGAEPLVTQAGWQDAFTVHTTPGTVDLQYAAMDVLASLPFVGEARALRFIQIRQGPDKVEGTLDDRTFKDLNEALSYLGMGGAAQAQQLAPLVTLNDPTVHILSTGHVGKVHRQVAVVARRVGPNPQILLWNEK